jgi:hypothetical protein
VVHLGETLMATVDIHRFATEASHKADEKEKASERTTVWAFVWTLLVFKIATVAVIFWAAEGSGEAGILIWATTWYWLAIPIFAIAGPLVYFVRIRRVRAKREQLRREEWLVE